MGGNKNKDLYKKFHVNSKLKYFVIKREEKNYLWYLL